jgi:hypothetical protein
MVAGGAAPSSYSKSFDPYHLPRIQAVESEIEGWLTYFDRHPEDRYVSDGEPGTVTVPSKSASKRRPLPGLRVVERP